MFRLSLKLERKKRRKTWRRCTRAVVTAYRWSKHRQNVPGQCAPGLIAFYDKSTSKDQQHLRVRRRSGLTSSATLTLSSCGSPKRAEFVTCGMDETTLVILSFHPRSDIDDPQGASLEEFVEEEKSGGSRLVNARNSNDELGNRESEIPPVSVSSRWGFIRTSPVHHYYRNKTARQERRKI